MNQQWMKKMTFPSDLMPPHGGYRNLKSFQLTQLVYDVTVRFCDRYVSKRSRTPDHMVQAARSGVQNIAEGSVASGTSKKTELKLTNVARASLEELRLDYEDFCGSVGLISGLELTGDSLRSQIVISKNRVVLNPPVCFYNRGLCRSSVTFSGRCASAGRAAAGYATPGSAGRGCS